MNRSALTTKVFFVFALLALSFAQIATAGSLYYTGTNTIWDNGTTADWATSPAGPYTSPWQGGSDAHFQGTAGSVTVSGSIASVNSLNFDSSGYTLTGGSINLTGGGSINVVSGGSATINSLLTGNAGLAFAGGSLTLGASNAYLGNTLVNSGTLTLQNTTNSPQFTIASGAILDLNGAISNGANTTFNGSGTLRKTGSGTVIWGFPSATFALQAGSLIDVESGTFFGGSSANEVWTNNLSSLNVASGATFSGVEANVVVDALTGSGTVSSGFPGAGYANFTFGVNGGSGTFAGVLADSAAPGNFVKSGSGIETLSGSNTYTGSTTINGGTLVLSGNANSNNSNITISNNAALAFSTASGNLGFTRAISGTGSVIFNVNGNTSASGGGDSSNFSMTNSGGFTGTVVINLGLVNPSADAAFGNPANVIQLNAGSGSGSGLVATVNLTLPSSRSIQLTTAGGNSVFRAYGGFTFEIDGVISGPGNLFKTDGGKLVLAGANTFSGIATVGGGTMLLANPAALAGSTFDTSGNGSLSFGTLTSASFGGLQGSGNLALNNSAAGAVALNVGSNNASTTFSGGLSGSGSLTKIGTGILTFTGMNSYGGNTAVNGGTLQILAGQLSTFNEYVGIGSSASLVQAGGAHSVSSLAIGSEAVYGSEGLYTLSGGLLNVTGSESIGQGGNDPIPPPQAAGSFTQSGGTHTVTSLIIGGEDQVSLSGNGSYSLSGGLLNVTGSELIGQGGGFDLITSSVGSFTQSGGTHTVASLVIGAEGQIEGGGSGSYMLSGGLLTVTGTEWISQGGYFSVGSFTQAGGTHSVASLVIETADQYGIGGNGSYLLGGGLLAVTGTEWISQGGSYSVGSFTQTGGTHAVSGSLVLAQSANASGTYNLNGGLLILSGAAGLVKGSGVAAFNFGGGTLQMGAGFTTSLPIVFSISGSNGTFDTDGNSLTLTDTLSGHGGLSKAGAGMLTLAGSYAYTGQTSVSGGTLVLLADMPSSSFAANNGGTLLFNAATINLNSRNVQALSGGTVQYQNATINGGFLRGPGTHVALAGSSNTFNAVTTYDTTNFQQNGPTTLSNFNNGGQIANNAPLVWDGGINNGGADLVVNSSVSTNDWTNAGVVTINHGGALNNHLGDATSFGGGRIYVNSGGTLNADSQAEGVALDLQDSLLVNDGRVTGTTNVYYGATLSGSGSFGPINVMQAGAVVAATTAVPAPTSLTVSSGSIAGSGNLGVSATLADAIIATPNLTDVLTLSGNLSGPGPVTKVGEGTLILSGTNTFGTDTNVEAGTVLVTGGYALPDGSNLTVGSGIAAFGSPIPTSAASQVVPVPEPGTLVLLVAGAALLAMYRKRRRQSNRDRPAFGCQSSR